MTNMDEKNEADRTEDVMLPGFRFHPTDEELVSFYLKKKIQQRPLPIELIKQVDIYKYDPWDLPNLAPNGEKEWYFYCPRDRKYRNSARPNRVTGAGFWKATGTDRPIHSSDGTKCIGLKKSLVFYRGRAAKGIKTDWMMHEFRLPSIPDAGPPRKFLDKNLPPHDAWAICRIFKKASSMTQRALTHLWASPLPETKASDMFNQGSHCPQFYSENMSCTTETGSALNLSSEFQQSSISSFATLDIPSYRPINATFSKPSPLGVTSEGLDHGFLHSSPDTSGPRTTSTVDVSSFLFNISPALTGDTSENTENIDFGGPQQQFSNFSMSPDDIEGSIGTGDDDVCITKDHVTTQGNNTWENIRTMGFPFSLPSSLPDTWRHNMAWDSTPCPSDMSATYPKCYT